MAKKATTPDSPEKPEVTVVPPVEAPVKRRRASAPADDAESAPEAEAVLAPGTVEINGKPYRQWKDSFGVTFTEPL